MDLIETPLSHALNRLLRSEPWARERLLPYTGESVEFRAPPLPAVRLLIAADGTVQGAARDAPPSLALTLKPEALAALPRGVEFAMREIGVEGNARLAAEILFLARHLRWDAEEALSRFMGDALAHRVVGGAQGLARAAADSGRRLAESLMEYALDERQLVVRRGEYDELAQANADLRDAIERLEKRLERLGRADG